MSQKTPRHTRRLNLSEPISQSVLDVFHLKFKEQTAPGDNGCIIWTGNRNWRGYGLAHGCNYVVAAHRLAYVLKNGPISPGIQVCHHCDNPPCVNPEHLFAGTARDNLMDAYRKGRKVSPFANPKKYGISVPREKISGENCHSSVLNNEQVLKIRELYTAGERGSDTGRKYGVSRNAIYSIVKRRTWTHI